MCIMKVLIAVIIAAVSAAASPSCPTGFVPQGNSCVCVDWPDGMVICDTALAAASMQIGYCMTYDNTTGELTAWRCIQSFFRNDSYKFYYPLPIHLANLNDSMCGPLNSRGVLCGECQDRFAAPPLHWDLCINCTGASRGWIKYVAVEYLPLTLLFMVIIRNFSISIVSGPINSFVFFAQITALAINRYSFNLYVYYRKAQYIGVVLALYNAWNWNISGVFPPSCMTDNFTRFQAMALDYIAAYYPLVLALFLYGGIKLHDQNFRPIIYCWKSLLNCFLRCRRNIHPNGSVIDAFATIILLSYVNVSYVIGFFLLPQPLYTYNSYEKKLTKTLVAVTNTNTRYFHSEHAPLPSFLFLHH